MGKCRERTKTVLKKIVDVLTPVGIAIISDMVATVEGTDWTNAGKREAAVDLSLAKLKSEGIHAKEAAVRAVVEVAVLTLKDGKDALADLASATHEDAAEA